MISVLVVTYDAERELALCRQSLRDAARELEPLGESLEVVVADNGSRDGTRALVRERFGEMRCLELGRNLGFGAANNQAVAVAGGELLLLLNPDAWLEAGSLPLLVERLQRDPGLGLVAPRFRSPAGERQFDWVPRVSLFGEAVQRVRTHAGRGRFNVESLPRPLRAVGWSGWYTAACAMVRRSAFEAVGGFDEGFFLYFEDVDLCAAGASRLAAGPRSRSARLSRGLVRRAATSRRPSGSGTTWWSSSTGGPSCGTTASIVRPGSSDGCGVTCAASIVGSKDATRCDDSCSPSSNRPSPRLPGGISAGIAG